MSWFGKKILAVAALLTAATFTSAHAATCQFGDQSDFTLSADVWTSTACEGQLDGNDSAATLNAFGTSGMFGVSTWALDSRFDRDTGAYGPSGLLTISNMTADFFQGDWSVSSWAGISAAVLVLKGGSGYSAYLLDLTAGTAGQWITQTLVNGGGRQPAISHISLYTAPAQVPLPAAGLLLVGAIGGLVGLRRRKKTA